MSHDIVMSVVVWLLYAAMSFAGLALIFIAVTRGHWLLLIPAAPLWLLSWVIRDRMHGDSP